MMEHRDFMHGAARVAIAGSETFTESTALGRAGVTYGSHAVGGL
ncbi:hypothetical protein [Streptomyces coelicoflavus]|nr:hypothetical protein [Streptomyces coelicoflavus]